MHPPAITTDRLLLRRWSAQDVEPFAAICSDPEVMRHIGTGATLSAAQAGASIDRFERAWDENGYGLFAVDLRESGRMIGFAGLSQPDFLPEIMPAVELGWRFARESWGNGYATEAARAALEFALGDRGIEAIVSIFQRENRASAGIVRKLGMRFDRETRDPTCGRAVEVHRTP